MWLVVIKFDWLCKDLLAVNNISIIISIIILKSVSILPFVHAAAWPNEKKKKNQKHNMAHFAINGSTAQNSIKQWSKWILCCLCFYKLTRAHQSTQQSSKFSAFFSTPSLSLGSLFYKLTFHNDCPMTLQSIIQLKPKSYFWHITGILKRLNERAMNGILVFSMS